ncbi:hypothetical protein [Mesorhizobium sp. KR9-304]|uniref:hypothetical protein n=1 Tax=Mesorhizobium sp. KR9-304 TaxID=3156614 RepID=UPI0032B47B90
MTPDEAKDAYSRAMDVAGEAIVIRRYTGTGQGRPFFDASVRARVVDYEPHEIIGAIKQGDRKLIVLAEDMIAAQIPLDLHNGDKAVVRGKELNIEAADDSTRRMQGVLIAYELQVRG